MCVIIHVSLLLYIFLNVLKKSVILRQDAPSIYIYFTTELCILKKEKQQQKGTFCDQVCCKEFCFMSLRILHLFQLCRPKWCIRKAMDCCRMQSHPPTNSNVLLCSNNKPPLYRRPFTASCPLPTCLSAPLWNVEPPPAAPGPSYCAPCSYHLHSHPQISLCVPRQSSLRAPSLRGPLAALRSARFASSSFLLSSRFFLDSSVLLRPEWKHRQIVNGGVTRILAH